MKERKSEEDVIFLYRFRHFIFFFPLYNFLRVKFIEKTPLVVIRNLSGKMTVIIPYHNIV